MKKIAVIGSNGFIGKNLLAKLAQYEVLPLTRKDIDITNLTSVKKAFEVVKPDIVINLAADKARGVAHEDFTRAINVNLFGTLNIVEASKATSSIKHLIFVGSCEEYGASTAPFKEEQTEAPISAYSFSKTCSKLLLETLKRQEELPFTYIRPTLVYGPNQGEEMFLPSLINALKNKRKFPLTKGEQIRDFIHVDDLSEAMIKIIEKGSVSFGQVYNLGSGEGFTIKEVAMKVATLLNAEEYLDVGAIPYRKVEIFNYQSSNEKITKSLGWKPQIKFEQGLIGLL